MKQNVPPAAMAAIIAVVLVIVVVIGMKSMSGNRSAGPSREEFQKRMSEHMKAGGGPPQTGGRPGYGSPDSSHGSPGSGGH